MKKQQHLGYAGIWGWLIKTLWHLATLDGCLTRIDNVNYVHFLANKNMASFHIAPSEILKGHSWEKRWEKQFGVVTKLEVAASVQHNRFNNLLQAVLLAAFNRWKWKWRTICKTEAQILSLWHNNQPTMCSSVSGSFALWTCSNMEHHGVMELPFCSFGPQHW